MPDPVIMAIATAVAGKVAESFTDQARQALAQLNRRIRAKFRHRPEDLAVLDAATAERSSPALVAQLSSRLEQASREDPGFGDDLRALWQRVQIEISAVSDTSTNVFTGSADKVVQARDIQGGLTIN